MKECSKMEKHKDMVFIHMLQIVKVKFMWDTGNKIRSMVSVLKSLGTVQCIKGSIITEFVKGKEKSVSKTEINILANGRITCKMAKDS